MILTEKKVLHLKDLEKIEKEMQKIVSEDYYFQRMVVSKEEALENMKQKGEQYKVELIEGLSEDEKI